MYRRRAWKQTRLLWDGKLYGLTVIDCSKHMGESAAPKLKHQATVCALQGSSLLARNYKGHKEISHIGDV